MELNILKDEKDKLIIEIGGEYSTLAAAIKNELWKVDKVKTAALNKKHPLVGKPEIVVEGPNPKELVEEATKNLKKDLAKFKKDFLEEC